MVPSNLSPLGSTSGIEEPLSLREMGRSPRRRIYGTQKWKTGLHGYTAKTDPEDMWPNHKTLRKGWWCRAFATAINRQCPTCNRLRTTEQFPPSLTQCLTCTRVGNKKKSSQFKRLDNQVDLIFRSALPEELEWENRAENVALSLDSIKRCRINMLTALDRDTPQIQGWTYTLLPPTPGA